MTRWLQAFVLGLWPCALLACATQHSAPVLAPSGRSVPKELVHSNLVRADYVGSAKCQPCHAEIYRSWLDSPMHRMTRSAPRALIRAPFDGTSLQVHDSRVTLEQHGAERFMRLLTAEGAQLFRVTKVIGGRYREDYAGIDVTGAVDPSGDRGRGAELVLPVSYLFSTRSLRPKGYSVMVHERGELAAGRVWAETCLGCHNTLPYLTYLYDDIYGEGAPPYQGTLSDHLLPRSRLWVPQVDDPQRLQRVLDQEIAFLGGEPPSAEPSLQASLEEAARVTQRRLDGRHVTEIGIGCEACHGGAREHVADPVRVRPAFGVRSPLLRLGPPDGQEPTRAQQINHVCARCHTVLFSQYPWTWEGGQRHVTQIGGSSISSGEARDLLLSKCSKELSCVACHDPHAEDSKEQLDALATPRGNATCTGCHDRYASPVALSEHSHHLASGEGSSCVQCHLPRKNMGLDGELTRYHRIGSPDEPRRVLGDRPLECALCHADKSVEQLTSAMERFWGKRYDRDALRALYGDDLDVNALDATLARGKPHEQAAAIGALGEQRVQRAVPELAEQLSHPYPLVRAFAQNALERISGTQLGFDVYAPADEVAAKARAWLAGRARLTAASDTH
jgi:predicted CXXCH cytochrome family protein